MRNCAVLLIAWACHGGLLAAGQPNILFILADDLGRGNLGSYGQQQIQTPHLDRLAAEGMRFTQAYGGACVCAPSRCVLMTGVHTGHCHIRDNQPVGMSLRPDDIPVASTDDPKPWIAPARGVFGRDPLHMRRSQRDRWPPPEDSDVRIQQFVVTVRSDRLQPVQFRPDRGAGLRPRVQRSSPSGERSETRDPHSGSLRGLCSLCCLLFNVFDSV